jgi:alpha/beta superfamily hydrolase
MIKEVMFNGEAGRIEGKYRHGERANSPAALILHPHPLHGGTMNNKVVYNMFHTFAKNQFSVLRFNFRGIGKSVGEFDHGQGELIDAATALDWLQSKNPEASSYWIAGFSFGAWITMQLLMRRPEIDGFVSVAPPASTCDFNFLSPCPIPGLIVQGTEDEISKEDDVYSLYEKLSKQKNSQIEYKVVEGADHFFTNQIEEMNQGIDDFIAPRLIKQAQPKKIRRDRKRKTIEM